MNFYLICFCQTISSFSGQMVKSWVWMSLLFCQARSRTVGGHIHQLIWMPSQRPQKHSPSRVLYFIKSVLLTFSLWSQMMKFSGKLVNPRCCLVSPTKWQYFTFLSMGFIVGISTKPCLQEILNFCHSVHPYGALSGIVWRHCVCLICWDAFHCDGGADFPNSRLTPWPHPYVQGRGDINVSLSRNVHAHRKVYTCGGIPWHRYSPDDAPGSFVQIPHLALTKAVVGWQPASSDSFQRLLSSSDSADTERLKCLPFTVVYSVVGINPHRTSLPARPLIRNRIPVPGASAFLGGATSAPAHPEGQCLTAVGSKLSRQSGILNMSSWWWCVHCVFVAFIHPGSNLYHYRMVESCCVTYLAHRVVSFVSCFCLVPSSQGRYK